jgi:hypothetical protein
MGFAKGSISLSPARDIPLLLQVLHSQFITHDQLREFMAFGGYELKSDSFNWRVRRLVESGVLQRHIGPGVTPVVIYSIGSLGKLVLAEHFPVMDQRRHKDAVSRVHLIHSLELNCLHLSLKGQGVLVSWQSEMSIRATNELTPDVYVKNYDAIVTVRLESRHLSFALEYERSPKKTENLLAHSNADGTGTEDTPLSLRCTGTQTGVARSRLLLRNDGARLCRIGARLHSIVCGNERG